MSIIGKQSQIFVQCICCGSNLSLVQLNYFPLFLCMVVYDSELKTKENKNKLNQEKIEPQHLSNFKSTVLWFKITVFLSSELMQCMRTEGKKMASAQPTGNYFLWFFIHSVLLSLEVISWG